MKGTWYVLDEIEKRGGRQTLSFKFTGGSHGTCSYNGMYINALADSVMLQLYLRFDFL